MKTITRWKKPLLAGAILSTLVVAGWGAIVFTTLWLRARCLRELTDRAQPLPQAGLYDHLNPQWIGAAASMSATGGLSLVTYWSDTTESDPLDRLIELQRPRWHTDMLAERPWHRRLCHRSVSEGSVVRAARELLCWAATGRGEFAVRRRNATARRWPALVVPGIQRRVYAGCSRPGGPKGR
jgi:hypothetical protein